MFGCAYTGGPRGRYGEPVETLRWDEHERKMVLREFDGVLQWSGGCCAGADVSGFCGDVDEGEEHQEYKFCVFNLNGIFIAEPGRARWEEQRA